MPDVNRKDLYKKFGPVLIEAIVLLMKDEINVLRSEAGLPERTNQQLMNAIQEKWENVDKTIWD